MTFSRKNKFNIDNELNDQERLMHLENEEREYVCDEESSKFSEESPINPFKTRKIDVMPSDNQQKDFNHKERREDDE